MSTGRADSLFLIDVARTLAEMARDKAEPRVRFGNGSGFGSRHLADSLQVRVSRSSPGNSNVHVPYYWALFVHDGRGPFGVRTARWLVWYKNPLEDPRLEDGVRQKRLKDTRRLTKDQFRTDFALGKLIVTKRVTEAMRPNRFFDNEDGMRGFSAEAGKVVAKKFSQHVIDSLGPLRRKRGTIKVKF